MINIYGLKNCDSCRKAIKWLEANKIEYKFFDFKIISLTRSTVLKWIDIHSLDQIINKRSTTWRNLDENLKNQLYTRSIDIIINSPSLIKRPIWEINSMSVMALTPVFGICHQDLLNN